MITKKSRRQLVREANFTQTLLRTLSAILIEHGGPLTVKRENLMLATNLRVDAQPDDAGNIVIRLQDENYQPLPSMVEDQ